MSVKRVFSIVQKVAIEGKQKMKAGANIFGKSWWENRKMLYFIYEFRIDVVSVVSLH